MLSPSSRYARLEKATIEQYTKLVTHLISGGHRVQPALTAWGIASQKHLQERVDAFAWKISKAFQQADQGRVDQDQNSLFYRLHQAYIHERETGFVAELKNAFINSVLARQYSPQLDPNQKALTDLRYPTEWFPATRTIQRKVYLHVGPTNSGKTYHALQKLEQSETGIYAGPLRLLAHEVYSRLNNKGVSCALITGEEHRIPEDVESYMHSCTVEMVPLNKVVDVAVIDEIQMIGDVDRGWAWTQAFLGVMAKEVHLCGEARVIPLIKDLCAATGDELIVREYQRLSPLQMERQSLKGDLKQLRKGDAVILFSRVQLHAMKKHIEQMTGKRCAIVYGSLPPETRTQQASLFNDPDNDYDFLVASDAVGMGLNLAIKRIIFDTTLKSDGVSHKPLSIAHIKQIAGRAGRYKTARDAATSSPPSPADGEAVSDDATSDVAEAEPNVGYVSTLVKEDFNIVKTALDAVPEPLKHAYILPPSSIISRFATYFPPGTPFSYILLRLNEISSISERFKLCRYKDQIEVSDLIHSINLSISDRITFTAAPVYLRDPGFATVLIDLARCVAGGAATFSTSRASPSISSRSSRRTTRRADRRTCRTWRCSTRRSRSTCG